MYKILYLPTSEFLKKVVAKPGENLIISKQVLLTQEENINCNLCWDEENLIEYIQENLVIAQSDFENYIEDILNQVGYKKSYYELFSDKSLYEIVEV